MTYDKLENLMASLRKVEVFSAAKQTMLLGELTDWHSKDYKNNVDGLKRAKQEIFDLFQEK